MGVKCAHCGEANEGWVPEDRLQKVADQRREAKSKITELEGQVTDLEGKVSDFEKASAGTEALTKQIEALQAEKAGWETERAVLGAGIADPEGLQVARALWATVPEDKRPEGGVAEWLKSDAAPKAVKAYMPEGGSGGAGEGGAGGEGEGGAGEGGAGGEGDGRGGEGGSTGLPNPNRGAVGGHTGRKPKFTAAQIEAMSPAEYAKHRDEILAD